MKKIKGILWSLSSFALISGVIFLSSCKTAPTKGENLKGKLEQKGVQNLSPKQVAVNTICHDFSSNMAKCYAHGQTNGNCDNVSEEINVIIIRSKIIVNSESLDNFSNLKFVARVGVGLDKVDLKECKKRNIKVLNTPLANADSVADLVLA